MRVNNLLEAAEPWRSKKAKDAFIEKEKAYIENIVHQLKFVQFSANGKDLTAKFEVLGIDSDFVSVSPYNPKGKKESVRQATPIGGVRDPITEYRLAERVLIRGSLSNGDVVEIEFNCRSISNNADVVNFSGTVIGGIVKRGNQTHYLTLPQIKRGGGGGGYRAPTPRIQLLIKQLSKYQAISDKLGKAEISQREKGMRKIKTMHADPSVIRPTIHSEIDNVSKQLKKLSLDNQLGKLSKDEFKAKIIELTDKLRSF